MGQLGKPQLPLGHRESIPAQLFFQDSYIIKYQIHNITSATDSRIVPTRALIFPLQALLSTTSQQTCIQKHSLGRELNNSGSKTGYATASYNVGQIYRNRQMDNYRTKVDKAPFPFTVLTRWKSSWKWVESLPTPHHHQTN